MTMETTDLRKAVETLLFITDHPVTLNRVAQITGEDPESVAAVVTEIQRDYEGRGSAIQVLEIAEGFRMATRPEFSPHVRRLFAEKMTMRLSTAALETLAIIAYKQPLTRAEIEEIRGVEVIAALETLLEKRLLKVVGRKETVGRPLLYGTTPEFLRHFGLRALGDLPPFESFAAASAAASAAAQGLFAGAGPVVSAQAPTGAEPAAGEAQAGSVAIAEPGTAKPPSAGEPTPAPE